MCMAPSQTGSQSTAKSSSPPRVNPWILLSSTPEQISEMQAERYAKTPEGMQARITELENRPAPAPAPTAAPLTAQQQQLISSGARLGTITQSQAAVKTASTAQRTPKRVAPIRSSLSTTYGTRQFTPSGDSTGLNVPQ